MPRRGRNSKSDQIATRRIEVAKLTLEGKVQAEIAEALDVAVGTVNSDLKVLREEWTKDQRHLIGPTVREELAKLDRAEVVVMRILELEDQAAARGKVAKVPSIAVDDEDEAGDPDSPAFVTALIVTDDVRLKAVDRLTKIQERRAKLLGLDAPLKVKDVSKNPLQELITRMAAEAAAGDTD